MALLLVFILGVWAVDAVSSSVLSSLLSNENITGIAVGSLWDRPFFQQYHIGICIVFACFVVSFCINIHYICKEKEA